MKKMSRFLSFLVTLALLLTIFNGCSKKDDKANDGNESKQALSTSSEAAETTIAEQDTVTEDNKLYITQKDPDDLEWKNDTSPVTLSAFINGPSAREWNWGNDYISKEVTKRTGVTIEATFDDGSGQKLSLMMASGEKLPDFLVSIATSSNIMSNLLKGDYLYSITELMDEYAPNMRKIMLKGEEEFNSIDGQLYYLSNHAYGFDHMDPRYVRLMGNWAVRQDILEELGNPPLNTSDDVVNVLTMVKEKYPEITYPLFLFSSQTAFPMFAMFGGKASAHDLFTGYDAASDEVYLWYERPEGKEALKFTNELYRKGLINPEMYTVTDFATLLDQGKIFLFGSPNIWNIINANAELAKNNPKAQYIPINPPTAPGRKHEICFSWSASTGSGVVITKDSTNPERAIKYLEFMKSYEGQTLFYYGVEGVDYDMVERDGIVYPQFKGQYASLRNNIAELSKESGIYSYDHYFWLMDAIYDYAGIVYTRYEEANKLAALCGDIAASYTNYSSKAGATASILSITSDTPAGKARDKINEYALNQLVKVALSKTDDDFEKEYSTLIENINKLGLDTFKKEALNRTKDYISKLDKLGYKWTE